MDETRRRDAAAWRHAQIHHWVVTRAELTALGFSRGQVRRRVRMGRLWPRYQDVFAVGRRDLTQDGEWYAAVLACGDDAALSWISGGVFWGVLERAAPRRHDVSIPRASGARLLDTVRTHRAPGLREEDIETHRHIRVTSLTRTLFDLAAIESPRGLKAALRQAQRRHRFELGDLRNYLEGQPRKDHRRVRLLRVVDAHVAGSEWTQSEREAVFHDLCAEHGIALPTSQKRIGAYRADFAWPALRLVVEIDDRESHEGSIAFADDRVRDRAMKAAGYETIRFTVAELLTQPEMVAREVLQAIGRRSGELGG